MYFLKFQTTDADVGINAQVFYTVLNYTEYVGVRANGSVYLRTALDSETVGNGLDITISVTDKGLPPSTSYTVLRLNINDLNDYSPLFDEMPDMITVPENINLCKYRVKYWAIIMVTNKYLLH